MESPSGSPKASPFQSPPKKRPLTSRSLVDASASAESDFNPEMEVDRTSTVSSFFPEEGPSTERGTSSSTNKNNKHAGYLSIKSPPNPTNWTWKETLDFPVDNLDRNIIIKNTTIDTSGNRKFSYATKLLREICNDAEHSVPLTINNYTRKTTPYTLSFKTTYKNFLEERLRLYEEKQARIRAELEEASKSKIEKLEAEAAR